MVEEDREPTTRSATHKSPTPPIRTATKSEEQKQPEIRPEPKLAKKPAPAVDDPWAHSVDKSGEMPVIRPRTLLSPSRLLPRLSTLSWTRSSRPRLVTRVFPTGHNSKMK